MPKYIYKCECGATEVEHSIADCDKEIRCTPNGHVMHRVPSVPETFFFGPGFASTDHIARANVGRNPSNQNRYSNYR